MPIFCSPQHDSSLLSPSRFEPLYNLPFQDAMISFAFPQRKGDHKWKCKAVTEILWHWPISRRYLKMVHSMLMLIIYHHRNKKKCAHNLWHTNIAVFSTYNCILRSPFILRCPIKWSSIHVYLQTHQACYPKTEAQKVGLHRQHMTPLVLQMRGSYLESFCSDSLSHIRPAV